MSKPFWKSLSIDLNQLPSRNRIARDLARRIAWGEHSALTGDLRIAKTSMLHYLAYEGNRTQLFGDTETEIIFNYIDCQTLSDDTNTDRFLALAIHPLTLGKYGNTASRNFAPQSTFELKAFLDDSLRGRKLVLILDEFDIIFDHPSLKNRALLGQLRSLASLRNDFVMLISSHYSLTELNHKVWDVYGGYGSPPLNIFLEYRLMPLTWEDTELALSYAIPKFSQLDCKYIYSVSGGHPYLIDIAASQLWTHQSSPNCYSVCSEEIYKLAEPYFRDKWQKWDVDSKKAILAVAILQGYWSLEKRKILTKELLVDISDFEPEIRHLRHSGDVVADANIPGGYRLQQGAMLWWLSDQLLTIVREKGDLDSWIAGRIEYKPSTSEKLKGAFETATKEIGKLLEKGSTTLIEAYVKSLVESANP